MSLYKHFSLYGFFSAQIEAHVLSGLLECVNQWWVWVWCVAVQQQLSGMDFKCFKKWRLQEILRYVAVILFSIVQYINNGNRLELRPIQFVIVQAINKIGQ